MATQDYLYGSDSAVTQSEPYSTESDGGITESGPITMASEGAVQAAAADPALLLRYEFNEGSGTTANDSSGNANHGTVNGPGGWSSATGDGSAWCLTTPGSTYVRPASIIDISQSNNALTLCSWVYNEQTGGHDARVITKASSGVDTDHVWMLGTHQYTSIRSRIETVESGVATTITTNQVPESTWVHIAVTFDGLNVRHYKNGVLVNTDSHAGTIGNDPALPIDIGGQTSNGSYFGGRIDDARIYQRALSAVELLAIYEGTETPPPGGDLEGGSLDSVGAVQSGAVTAAYTLEGGSLDSVGAVQSGEIAVTAALEGGSLDSVGAVQSGAVTASYTLEGGSLDSVGAVQPGAITAAYTLEGGSLDSVGAIQSGAISVAYAVEGGDLDSVGAISSGAISASYTLDGSDLDSVGAIQSGEITVAPPGLIQLEGGDLDSIGAIQSGAISASYQLEGGNLDSVGAIKSGRLAGDVNYDDALAQCNTVIDTSGQAIVTELSEAAQIVELSEMLRMSESAESLAIVEFGENLSLVEICAGTGYDVQQASRLGLH